MIGTKDTQYQDQNGVAADATLRFPPSAVRQQPGWTGVDPLTRHTRGLKFWSTGLFTGAVPDPVLWQPAPGNRTRVRRVSFQVTANSAISGGAAEVTVKLLDNGSPTNIEWTFFIPTNSGTNTLLNSGMLDLGEGYVQVTPGGALTIHADNTLTTGHFKVIAGGDEEQGQ